MVHANSTQRPQGPATVVAISTAFPPNVLIQAEVPDLVFRISNSEHLTDLKKNYQNVSGAIASNVDLTGFMVHLSRDVPKLASENAEICLEEALAPLGISDRNSIFWAVHPRGAAILNSIEAKLKIPTERLVASRNVLANYGNMQSATAMIVLDEMRKQSVETKKATTGEGFEWGVLLTFRPGMTAETIVLCAVTI